VEDVVTVAGVLTVGNEAVDQYGFGPAFGTVGRYRRIGQGGSGARRLAHHPDEDLTWR
jgi:hypothetical protein